MLCTDDILTDCIKDLEFFKIKTVLYWLVCLSSNFIFGLNAQNARILLRSNNVKDQIIKQCTKCKNTL